MNATILKTLINYTTLTPVVMSSSSGEFAVAANRQDGDLCAHSIRMVGVGWLPPNSQEDVFIDTAPNRQKTIQTMITVSFLLILPIIIISYRTKTKKIKRFLMKTSEHLTTLDLWA